MGRLSCQTPGGGLVAENLIYFLHKTEYVGRICYNRYHVSRLAVFRGARCGNDPI
jgi:hypothetical protein